MFPQVVQRH